MNLRECKRCLLYEMADDAAYGSVKNYINAMDPKLKAAEELYKSRLEKCRECDYLLSGMCRACGCFVEIRAIRRDAECPAAQKRW